MDLKMDPWWILLIVVILVIIIIGIIWAIQPPSNSTSDSTFSPAHYPFSHHRCFNTDDEEVKSLLLTSPEAPHLYRCFNTDTNGNLKDNPMNLSPAQFRSDHWLNFQPLEYELLPPPKSARLLILTQRPIHPILAQMHVDNLSTYSQEHGYTLEILDETAPPVLKLERILAALQTETWDYLLWLDPQTRINKPHWDLRRIYGAPGAREIMMGRTFAYNALSCGEAAPFCAGAFLLKASLIVQSWLMEAMLEPQSLPLLTEKYREAVSEVGPSLILNWEGFDANGFIINQLAPPHDVLESFQLLSNPKFNSFRYLIILTTTLSPPGHIAVLRQNQRSERLRWYQRAQERWNQDVDSNFEVMVVENSGDRFEEEYPNLSYVYLDTSAIPTNSKGRHELLSIQHALATINLADYDYIIKITGRYYIPDFKMLLKSGFQYRSIQGIRQSNPDRCEVVGARSDLAHHIFNPKARLHVEDDYKDRLSKLGPIHVLNRLLITRTANGGANELVEVL